MSRRALWPASADPAGANGADQPLASAPTAPPGAPAAPLPPRSSLDTQVKLARLADLFNEAGKILKELSEVPLAVHAERALMCDVETAPARRRLMTIQDIAELLQIEPRTVRRMRARGQLPPALDLHNVLRWDETTIYAWLEGRREQ